MRIADVVGGALGGGAAVEEAAAGRLGVAPAAGGPAGVLALLAPEAGVAAAYPLMPARSGYAPRALAFAPAARGYAGGAAAAKATAPKRSASARSASTKSAKSSTSRSAAASKELAFLDDPRLSLEDKLFRFMALMQQKSDRELVDAMKQYEEKKAAAKRASSSDGAGSSAAKGAGGGGGGGGGLFGFIGDALGGLAKTVVSGAETLAKDLGGPLLAAGCTAVGLPELAPLALQIGGPLARSAVSGLASAVGLDEPGAARSAAPSSGSAGSTAASSQGAAAKGSASGASAEGGEFDEKLEMLKLQRLVEKQATLFSALSNVLKSQHDSQMVAVSNIR